MNNIEEMSIDQIQSYLVEERNYLLVEGFPKDWCEKNLDIEFDTDKDWTEFAAYMNCIEIDAQLIASVEGYKTQKAVEELKEHISAAERLDNMRRDYAFEEGQAAYSEGESLNNNPYEDNQHQELNDDYLRDGWIAGYEQAQN